MLKMLFPWRPFSRYIRVVCAGAALACFYAVCVTVSQFGNQVLDEERYLTLTALRYNHPHTEQTGKVFNVSHRDTVLNGILTSIKQMEYVDLNKQTLDDFVFVTAADEGHFAEVFDAVASIQAQYPDKVIIFYDLGLSFPQVNKVKTFCNIKYKLFNFSIYPAHVRTLTTYSWKVVLLWEELTTHTGLIWFDSSVRLHTNNLTFTKETIVNTNGIALLTTTGHSTYAVTHPDMYLYLPIHQKPARKEQRAMTAIALYRTKTVIEDIMFWLLLCSLDQNCIAPTWRIFCTFEDRFLEYAGCHRFDQSAMNIILLNLYKHDNYIFYPEKQTGVSVQRMETKYFKLKICPSN